jgi:hypothetical protein
MQGALTEICIFGYKFNTHYQMPEISRFFGIIIKMFFDDHNLPHFHAEFQEFRAIIEIDGAKVS